MKKPAQWEITHDTSSVLYCRQGIRYRVRVEGSVTAVLMNGIAIGKVNSPSRHTLLERINKCISEFNNKYSNRITFEMFVERTKKPVRDVD